MKKRYKDCVIIMIGNSYLSNWITKFLGSVHRPIIAFHVTEKSQVYERKGKIIVINEGNYDSSSQQMEHAILIAIIDRITPVVEKNDVILDIGIDGDLNSNKTLTTQKLYTKFLPILNIKQSL